MNLFSILLSLSLITLIEYGESAKILFFIGGITSHSHRVSIQPLANRLAERGHEVTFHTPLVMSKDQVHPKIKEFCTDSTREFMKAFQADYGVSGLKVRVENKYVNDMFSHPTAIFDWAYIMSQTMLGDSKFIEWVDSSQFDLIIMDSAINEFVFGLAHIFKAKTIVYGSVGSVLMWDVGRYGIPAEMSWVPAYDSMYQGSMGFWDRLYNAYLTYRWSSKSQTYHLPNLDKLLRETLGHRVKDMPPLEELVHDTSLMLINQHYSDNFARPYPPFVIPVGGMHVEKPNATLPKGIEAFIHKGDAGFIYVSFGSIVRISTMPDWLLQVFLTAMKNSKLRFLWKWEGDVPKNVPENVFFYPWFPQQNVLAHPKIRGFVMQGGQVSIQQANCNGVPLIMFPVNGDQDFSAKRMRIAGNGIEMEFAGLTAPELEKAFQDIVNVPIYKEKAKELEAACRDRPQSPVDTAQWWVEYVLRTKDTHLLKPMSMDQPLWMYWCVDIWAFVFSMVLAAILTTFFVVKFIYKIVLGSKSTTDAKKKKKN